MLSLLRCHIVLVGVLVPIGVAGAQPNPRTARIGIDSAGSGFVRVDFGDPTRPLWSVCRPGAASGAASESDAPRAMMHPLESHATGATRSALESGFAGGGWSVSETPAERRSAAVTSSLSSGAVTPDAAKPKTVEDAPGSSRRWSDCVFLGRSEPWLSAPLAVWDGGSAGMGRDADDDGGDEGPICEEDARCSPEPAQVPTAVVGVRVVKATVSCPRAPRPKHDFIGVPPSSLGAADDGYPSLPFEPPRRVSA